MKRLFASICMLLVIFMFAVFAPPASAFEVNTASVGLTTAPMELSEYSSDALYEGLTIDAEFDINLASDVPLLGSIVTDTRIKYGGIDLNELDELTGRTVDWRIALYAQPVSWLRVGPIISQDEFSRALKTAYTVRIGKHF